MQLTPLLALAGMAGIALSNPIATPTPDDTDAGAVYRRSGRNVYRCDGQGWVNNCWLITDPTNCHNRMTSLGSFGPDKGLSCTMFENRGCTGRVAAISYPGVGSMWDWENKGGFNVNSWQCRWTL
jgi:hypothetical protein